MVAKVLIYPSTLKMLRKRREWSQEELAHQALVVPATVKRIESPSNTGAYACRSDVAHKLAAALNVSVEDLGGYDDDCVHLKVAQLDLILGDWDREKFLENSVALADYMDRRQEILRRTGLVARPPSEPDS